jgi:hypothetical protein
VGLAGTNCRPRVTRTCAAWKRSIVDAPDGLYAALLSARRTAPTKRRRIGNDQRHRRCRRAPDSKQKRMQKTTGVADAIGMTVAIRL